MKACYYTATYFTERALKRLLDVYSVTVNNVLIYRSYFERR